MFLNHGKETRLILQPCSTEKQIKIHFWHKYVSNVVISFGFVCFIIIFIKLVLKPVTNQLKSDISIVKTVWPFKKPSYPIKLTFHDNFLQTLRHLRRQHLNELIVIISRENVLKGR